MIEWAFDCSIHKTVFLLEYFLLFCIVRVGQRDGSRAICAGYCAWIPTLFLLCSWWEKGSNKSMNPCLKSRGYAGEKQDAPGFKKKKKKW